MEKSEGKREIFGNLYKRERVKKRKNGNVFQRIDISNSRHVITY